LTGIKLENVIAREHLHPPIYLLPSFARLPSCEKLINSVTGSCSTDDVIAESRQDFRFGRVALVVENTPEVDRS